MNRNFRYELILRNGQDFLKAPCILIVFHKEIFYYSLTCASYRLQTTFEVQYNIDESIHLPERKKREIYLPYISIIKETVIVFVQIYNMRDRDNETA